MRIVGIDPGTKSFDFVVLEGEKIVEEVSLETVVVAKEPRKLIESIDRLQPDYVVAPSGYGVPLMFGDNVRDARKLAIEVLLLSSEEDIVEGVKVGEIGIWVYDALAKTVEHLVKVYKDKVVFLPAVIHLRTVPRFRKLNKVDMGTVDKLASTFVSVYEVAKDVGYDFSKVNVVVVELGFGYTAAIAVAGGRVVDGIGGSYASVGTLTAGALDLEVVVGVKNWMRWDVFHGGIFYSSNLFDLNGIVEGFRRGEEPHTSMFKAFIEGVAKDIKRASVSTPKADIVLLTGRHSKNTEVVKYLREVLSDYEIKTVKGLKGASIAKEAAQGYTAIGEGVVGTVFKDLVKHMGIEEACGTVVDYIVHPRAEKFIERIKRAYLESVYKPKLCREE
ncbi:MAG: DUF1464 family protein [Ignisphaera sp.]